MPRVTIEYELPREKKELEDALMGAEAAGVLEQLRQWLTQGMLAGAGALKDSKEFYYRAGLEACAAQLNDLLAGRAAELAGELVRTGD